MKKKNEKLWFVYSPGFLKRNPFKPASIEGWIFSFSYLAISVILLFIVASDRFNYILRILALAILVSVGILFSLIVKYKSEYHFKKNS